MSKKFGRKTLTQVNLPGRGNKTENPKNENKKTKNIYKMLVEKGDDQEKPQKKHKNQTKPKKQNVEEPPNITEEQKTDKVHHIKEVEIKEIKELLITCNSIFSEIKQNMSNVNGNDDFRCEHEGCDKTYKRRGNLLKHEVDKHGVKPDPKILEIIKQDASNTSLNTSTDFKEIKESKTSTQLPTTGVTRKRSTDSTEDEENDEERLKKIRTEEGEETDEEEEETESPKAKERRSRMKAAMEAVQTQKDGLPDEQESQSESLNLMNDIFENSDNFATPDETFALNNIPNPNNVIIRQLEDNLATKNKTLTDTLAENITLKSKIALAKKEKEKLVLKLERKEKEMEKLVEEATKISDKAANKQNDKNLTAQITSLRKLNTELAEESERWKSIAEKNATLSTQMEANLKDARSRIELLEKKIECRNPKCDDPKRCGRSHDNKYKKPEPMDTSNTTNPNTTGSKTNQCNFYNRGTCKKTDDECPYNHDKEEKFKFLETTQRKKNEEREKERDQGNNKKTENKDKQQKDEKKDKNNKKKHEKEKEKGETSNSNVDFQQPGPMHNQPGNIGPGSNMLNMNPMMTNFHPMAQLPLQNMSMMTPTVAMPPPMPTSNWQHQEALRMELERTQALLNWQMQTAPGSLSITHLRNKAIQLEQQLQRM